MEKQETIHLIINKPSRAYNKLITTAELDDMVSSMISFQMKDQLYTSAAYTKALKNALYCLHIAGKI